MNQVLADGDIRCSYDARGNATTCKSASESWSLVFNNQNLLVKALAEDGRSIEFDYDAFGRRIWKRTQSTETRYFWAGENLVGEITSSGDETTQRSFAYIPGTHTPLAMKAGEAVYCHHTDHLGATRRMTDGRGQLVWAAEYESFGQARIHERQIQNPLRLPGQYHDVETGFHYNRFRYYSPQLGRYVSRDPLSYFSGLNFYCYCGNDPINLADPLGLWSWKSVVAGVAAVAVGVAVVALAPIALPAAIIAGGVAAGAVGFGLNEALHQEKFCLSCILKEAGRGALIGGIAAAPFALLPATAGVAAFAGAGAASGGIGYIGDVVTGPATWDWGDFGKAVALGAGTAGVVRYLGIRWASRGNAKSGTPPYRYNSKTNRWHGPDGKFRNPPTSEQMREYARSQGWRNTKTTKQGYESWTDSNGVVRMKLKPPSDVSGVQAGSQRPRGPIRDANNQRVGGFGRPVTLRSPSAHAPLGDSPTAPIRPHPAGASVGATSAANSDSGGDAMIVQTENVDGSTTTEAVELAPGENVIEAGGN